MYRYRETNKAFEDEWGDAQQEAFDGMEFEARRRAVEGVEETRYDKNGGSYTVIRYSDTLLIFLLKAARPEKFRDNFRIEHGNADGKPVLVEYVNNYRA